MSHYRALLLDISQHLTAEDLTSLKYLCKEIIPAGRAERITSALEFFSELERRKLLSDENRHFWLQCSILSKEMAWGIDF